MRLRPVPTPPGPEIPDRQRRCVVEHWVEPTEMPRWVDKEINGTPTGVDEVASKLMLLTRRRHKDAVAEWVAQAELDRATAGRCCATRPHSWPPSPRRRGAGGERFLSLIHI